MGNQPDVPQVADPNVTAAQQQKYNTDAAQQSQQGSMVNTQGPTGGFTYQQTGTGANGTPIYTLTQSLTPQTQALLDQLQKTQGVAGSQASQLLTAANYGANGQTPGDVIGNDTSGLTSRALGQQVSYLKPFFDQQSEQLDNQLRNQGFAPGQPAYDNAMQNMTKSQGATVTNYLSNIEPQMFQQATQTYQMPLSMAGTEMGLSQPQMPGQFQTPGLNIAPTNLISATGNAQQAQMAAYKAQQDQYNNTMSGIMGIPTAVLGGWASAGGAAPFMAAL